jgi:hypothetical protein
MTRRILTRWFSSLALATALVVGLSSVPARAQEGEAGKTEESGRSGDGYIATAVLAGIALFVVAKSARR